MKAKIFEIVVVTILFVLILINFTCYIQYQPGKHVSYTDLPKDFQDSVKKYITIIEKANREQNYETFDKYSNLICIGCSYSFEIKYIPLSPSWIDHYSIINNETGKYYNLIYPTCSPCIIYEKYIYITLNNFYFYNFTESTFVKYQLY